MAIYKFEDVLQKHGVQATDVKTKGAPTPESAQPGLLSRVVSDIGEDVSTMYGNLREAGVRDRAKIDAINQNVESGAVTPGAGAVQTVGTGMRGGADLIGQGVTTIGKLFLTENAEKNIKLGTEDLGTRAAQTDTVKTLVQKYQALTPEQKALVDGTLGIAEGLGTMFGLGPAVNAFKTGVSTGTKAAIDTGLTVGREVVDTTKDVATDVVTKTGNVVQPVVDTVSGIKNQVVDYGKRVVNEAQDNAQTARRLDQLPEPEANLIRAGADERVVNVIKQAPKEEVSVYRELVDQAKRKETDPTPNTAQPKEIAGREFLKPVDYLLKQRDAVGKKLGDVRKNLSQAPLDVTQQFKQFQQYLNQELGVYVNSQGKFVSNRGKIAPSDLAELQKLYNELRPDNTGKVIRSQRWIDDWSQRTFKEYDLRQAREKTFSDDVTRTVERARNIFKQSMPVEYNKALTDYSTVMKPIQDMVQLLGYKGDISKLTAKELKAGEVALRMLGNAADRPQSVIDEVLTVAGQYGYKSNVDLNRVIYFADQLEDLYDITPTRGFSGSSARGVNQSTVGALSDVATGNAMGILDKAMSSAATRKERQAAFEAFLNSL